MEFTRKPNTSPEFLISLLEHTSEGIIAFDMNFNVTFRNRRASEIHGIPPEEGANNWPDHLTVMDSEGIHPVPQEDLPLMRAFRGESVNDSYHVLKRKNLPSIFVKYNAHPIYDESAKQTGVIVTTEDAEDLAKSLARFKAIFDQSPLSVQIADKTGKTVLVNSSYQKLWGISDEVVKNFVLKDYNILQDKILESTGELEMIKRAWEGETVQIPEFLYDPKSSGVEGRPRWASGVLYPLKNELGQVSEVVIIHLDNTERKNEEITKNFLADLTSALISTVDPSQVINKVVDKALPFLADGCMVDLCENNQIQRLVSKHINPKIQVLMDELTTKFPPNLDSPQPTSRAIRMGTPELMEVVDHNIILRNTYNEEHAQIIKNIGIKSHIAVPLKIRGKILGAINLFVTGERAHFNQKDFSLAEEVARIASVAIENAKLYKEAKDAIQLRDDFISMASHELRTPITSMGLQLEVLRSLVDDITRNSDAPGLMKKFIESTNGQLQRLTRLVDDMLDISRISAGKLSLKIKVVNICDIVHGVVERFQDQLKNLNYEMNVDCPEKVMTSCDPDRIDQVITNFMTNAIRYGNKNPIHLKLHETGSEVIISIRDQGRGIHASDHERIFKRFERSHTSQDVNGLGLGLYINQQIVQEHGGRIELTSALGEGSTFTVYLPKA